MGVLRQLWRLSEQHNAQAFPHPVVPCTGARKMKAHTPKPQVSRLAALRAARAHNEAPIREPLERELRTAARMLSEARASQRAIERLIGSDIGKNVVKAIGAHMSAGIQRKIIEAIMSATPTNATGRPEWIELHLSSGELAWLDPASIERRALDAWKEQSLPRLSISVDAGSKIAREQHVTIIDVRIPKLGYRQHVANSMWQTS